MKAKLFAKDDGGSYEFDYHNTAGELNWFDPDSRAIGDLTELLVGLRKYFLAHGLWANEEGWSGCVATLDVENIKNRH